MVPYELKETLIRINNIHKGYGERQILRGINAEIKNIVGAGQVVGMLGPSGVGKTTLLRLLAGLDKPDSGEIMVYDNIAGHEVPIQTGVVGVVAQNYPLFQHRTIMGNLLLAATRKEKNETIAKERIYGLLERFHLSDKVSYYPSQLSGGQRQRIAIIQQLLCSDHYILMDEPFSGLDPVMKMEVCELIKEVASLDEHNTLIIVTHDVAEAIAVSDTLWLMGRDIEDVNGVKSFKQGAYLKKQYNLATMGMAWKKDIHLTPEFSNLVREIKQEFLTL